MNHRNSSFRCQRLHRRLSRLLFPFLLGGLLLTGCASLPLSGSADEAFSGFTRQLFQNEVAASTIGLHYTLRNPSEYGVTHCPVTYGSFSADSTAAKASVENCRAALRRFDPDALSDGHRLTYQVLDSYLENAAGGAEFVLYQEPLSPVTGLHAQLPVLLSEYQFYQVSDVDTYLSLLAQTGTYFDSLITFEQAKADAGLFMPAYQTEAVTEQCRSFVEMGSENYLYSTFATRLEALDGLSASAKEAYIRQNAKLIETVIFPAYDRLTERLDALKGTGKNEEGLCHFTDGKEYYQYLVRQCTGIREGIPALQQMTKAQITEDLAEMEKILFPADVPLSDASVLEQASPTSILGDLKQKMADAFPEVPAVHFQVKYVPSAMEEYLSPAFYMIPALDNYTENVIYINKGQTVEGLNLYTTLAHEGYPGHLYQNVYYASTKPDPVRCILDFGGYTEGWATYTEMMSYYMAPLSKNEASLLQKNSSVLLGLYSLADMGIHYDGWSLAETTAFFKDYGITDLAAIRSIYELIVGNPGNYLKYYLGYLKFFHLKQEIAAQLGEQFSQKEFHRAVLDVGPAPFDIVETEVRRALLGEF